MKEFVNFSRKNYIIATLDWKEDYVLKKSIKATLGAMVAILFLNAVFPLNAFSFSINNDNTGYADGAYDLSAVKPTASSWSSQLDFSCPDIPYEKLWIKERYTYESDKVIGRDGTIYYLRSSVPANVAELVALNPDGSEKWVCELRQAYTPGITPVIGKDGSIICAASGIYVYENSGKNYKYIPGNIFAVTPEGKVKWQYTSKEPSYSDYIGPILLAPNGEIYIMSFNGLGGNDGNYSEVFIMAIDPRTGKERMVYRIKNAESNIDMVMGKNGTILVFYKQFDERININKLLAIDTNGRKKWEVSGKLNQYGRYDKGIVSMPAIGSDNTVYGIYEKIVPETISYHLAAYDDKGKLKWMSSAFLENELMYAWVSAPVISDDGTIYVYAYPIDIYSHVYKGKLYAFDLKGKLKWSLDVGGTESSELQLGANGEIYFMCAYPDPDIRRNDTRLMRPFLCAVSPEGKVLWKYDTGYYFVTSLIIGADGTIYTRQGLTPSSLDTILLAIGTKDAGTTSFASDLSFTSWDRNDTGVCLTYNVKNNTGRKDIGTYCLITLYSNLVPRSAHFIEYSLGPGQSKSGKIFADTDVNIDDKFILV